MSSVNRTIFLQNAIKAEQFFREVLWMQKPVAFYLIVVGIVGTLGNTSVVYLTIRYRYLRQSYNLLLACLCASSFAHQLGLWPMFYIIFSETIYIPLQACFYIQALPLVGNMAAELLPLLIGIDRAFCIFRPVLHRNMDRVKYCAVNILICAVYAFVIVYNAYLYSSEHPNDAVYCGVIEVLDGNVSYAHFLSCATINSVALLCYGIVWMGLRNNKNIRENNKRVFLCTLIMMVTLFAGWFSVSALRIILISVVKATPIQMFYMKLYGVICINTTCASQSLIIIWFSGDYGRALSHLLGFQKIRTIRATPRTI